VNGDLTLFEVHLTGLVEAADEAEGEVFVELHHLSKGEGILEHALGLVDTFVLEGPGELDHTWWHPSSEGRGLVVYAWQDRDADGQLCAPGTDDEPVALASFSELEHELTVDLSLVETCVGPERLVPEDR
jgi:hypothetical protein